MKEGIALKLILLLTLIIIFSLIYILLKDKDKSALLTFCFSILILYIVLNPKECIAYTIGGAKLFFHAVFPSLFPFLVIVNLIISFGGIEIYSRLFGNILCRPLGLPKECSLVLFISIFCGYPLGARYAGELYSQNNIDKATFERLLNIATNGSPLFIIGSVGTAMLGHPSLGYILIISNLLSCLVMGFILPNKYKYKNKYKEKKEVIPKKTTSTTQVNFGLSMKNALEDATKTCLSIGSFVIIFSVIINIIKGNALFDTALVQLSNVTNIKKEIYESFTLGILEVTNGCNLIAKSTLSYNIKLIISSFLIAFSGLSITSQVYSLIYKYNVSMKRYISLKVLQGAIAAFITLCICNIPLLTITKDAFVNDFHGTFSSTLVLFLIILFIAFPIILNKIKELIRIP